MWKTWQKSLQWAAPAKINILELKNELFWSKNFAPRSGETEHLKLQASESENANYNWVLLLSIAHYMT